MDFEIKKSQSIYRNQIQKKNFKQISEFIIYNIHKL